MRERGEGQFTANFVDEEGAFRKLFKAVRVAPVTERSANLLVDKAVEAKVLGVAGMPDDGEGPHPDPEDDLGAGLKSQVAAENAHGLPGRSEQLDGIRALVKGEHGLAGGLERRSEAEVQHLAIGWRERGGGSRKVRL